MELKEFLTDLKKVDTVTSFAQRVGISTTYLYEIMRGEKFPRPEIIDNIKRETRSKVTYNDLRITFKG